MKITGAQIVIEELVNQGVETIFGYPGGTVINIYDELYKNADRIEHILTAHEQGAVHAADGYARASGGVGVVLATSGPGATNLITGIANAYLDSVPLVAITGNVAVPLLGRDSFQEVDIMGITLPIVKHNFVVRDVSKLEHTLKKAFLIANSGRKGPVLVDITKDVQIAECEYTNKTVELKNYMAPPENDYQRAIDMVNNSKKPYIYCGGGTLASGASELVMELSKKIDAPIGLSMMGLTAIPRSYDLNLGMSGMHGNFSATKTQSEADLIIAVGVRFSDRATGKTSEFTKNCDVIHIDIDAAEINKNIQSKLGICSDIKTALEIINKEVVDNPKEKWISEVKGYQLCDLKPDYPELFTPQNILSEIKNKFGDDTIVATDVGQHQMWVMQYYKFEKQRTLLTSGGLGTMGFGMGAAIGGCMASGKKRTVLVTSDGSFGMNLNEMATAVSEDLPLVVILLNNGVLGMVRQWQTLFYEKRYSSTTLDRKTNFPMLAQAFGADGYRATTINELKEVLDNKIADNKPCLIECIINEDVKVLPMIPPGASVNEIIMELE